VPAVQSVPSSSAECASLNAQPNRVKLMCDHAYRRAGGLDQRRGAGHRAALQEVPSFG